MIRSRFPGADSVVSILETVTTTVIDRFPGLKANRNHLLLASSVLLFFLALPLCTNVSPSYSLETTAVGEFSRKFWYLPHNGSYSLRRRLLRTVVEIIDSDQQSERESLLALAVCTRRWEVFSWTLSAATRISVEQERTSEEDCLDCCVNAICNRDFVNGGYMYLTGCCFSWLAVRHGPVTGAEQIE